MPMFRCDDEQDIVRGADRSSGRTVMIRASARVLLCAVLPALLIVSGCAPAKEPDSTPPDSPQIRDESEKLTISPGHDQQVRIVRLEPSSARVPPGGQVWLTCIASAQDGDTLSYEWGATGGSFSTPRGR